MYVIYKCLTSITDYLTMNGLWGLREQNTVRVTRTMTLGKGYHHIDSEVAGYGLSQYIFSARQRFTLEVRPLSHKHT